MTKMKNVTVLLSTLLMVCVAATAQTRFRVGEKVMTSSRQSLYVNPSRKSKPSAFTFSNVAEALRFAEKAGGHTTIYIEPSVYWIDNPDDAEIRRPEKGSNTPFGIGLQFDDVKMVGLSSSPEDVVLASNRGQTQGADGNFTMMYIKGDNIEAENITFGNYCNVDLVYPRNPKLNRQRRKDAIVQAQLVIASGNAYKMKNCRFISRLNLCPFVGPSHVDFDNCYFECTDDALCGTGTYRHCRFTFYSSKPFYCTSRGGAEFYDCDIHCKTRGVQYLTKVSDPVKMDNCRWTSDDPNLRIEWNKRPDPEKYCVMTNCTLNGVAYNVPTPTEPLPVNISPFCVQNQPEIRPGAWTLDAYKPEDTRDYDWQPDAGRAAWGYAEGIDGAENEWGLVQLQKGARMMWTPTDKDARREGACEVMLTLVPCKGPGQGFGSATGQYMDVCIAFDTRTLTGCGVRFVRTPDYDKAVEMCLVTYSNGKVTKVGNAERCDLYKPQCVVTVRKEDENLTAMIEHDGKLQTLQHQDASLSGLTHRGFMLQHTGSTGASATVVKGIRMK